MDRVIEHSIPKNVDEPEANEDCWDITQDGVLAILSDGASESFDSRSWARLLVQCTLESGGSMPVEEIESAAIRLYRDIHDPSQLSWSKRLAYERGSFATLLICRQVTEHDSLDINCIGDSVAIVFDEERVVCTHGYKTSAQFDERPRLLSSRAELNGALFLPDCCERTFVSVGLKNLESPRLWMMTDALGAWALRCIEEGRGKEVLDLAIMDEPAFRAFVIERRERREMRTDDTTLLVFDL